MLSPRGDVGEPAAAGGGGRAQAADAAEAEAGRPRPGPRTPRERAPAHPRPSTGGARTAPARDRARRIAYAPDLDGAADPGEIVWTWVPFEEDDGRGKDRPVLVVGREGRDLVGLMLSSQSERADDRNWIAVGSGVVGRAGAAVVRAAGPGDRGRRARASAARARCSTRRGSTAWPPSCGRTTAGADAGPGAAVPRCGTRPVETGTRAPTGCATPPWPCRNARLAVPERSTRRAGTRRLAVSWCCGRPRTCAWGRGRRAAGAAAPPPGPAAPAPCAGGSRGRSAPAGAGGRSSGAGSRPRAGGAAPPARPRSAGSDHSPLFHAVVQ